VTSIFTKHGLHTNNKERELAPKKVACAIKYFLNKKTEEPIYIAWKVEDIKEIEGNYKEHKDQGIEKRNKSS
jgi:hypothetical protein